MEDNRLLKLISDFDNGEVDRLAVLDMLLVVAGVDDVITRSVKVMFRDCSKVNRRVGKPRKIDVEEILVRRIAGDTYKTIADDLDISMSSAYRAVRDNKVLENKLRNEIFNKE